MNEKKTELNTILWKRNPSVEDVIHWFTHRPFYVLFHWDFCYVIILTKRFSGSFVMRLRWSCISAVLNSNSRPYISLSSRDLVGKWIYIQIILGLHRFHLVDSMECFLFLYTVIIPLILHIIHSYHLPYILGNFSFYAPRQYIHFSKLF